MSEPRLSSHGAQSTMAAPWPNRWLLQSHTVWRDLSLGLLISGLIISGNLGVRRYQSNFAVSTPIVNAQVNIPSDQNSQSPLTGQVESKQLSKSKQPSSKDLQKLLNKWQAKYSYASFGVVVQEFGGQKRTAALNPDKIFSAASLYKLYLADYVYTKVEHHQLSLSQQLGTSKPLGDCLQLMIVISDNSCGESIGWAVGWVNLHNFVRAKGYTRTTLSPYNRTSAGDVAKYLKKLRGGKLLNAKFSKDLLRYMRRQIYRSGIPAGVPKLPVADKVGIINSYWHDAAIIYHPHGDYILVVLSSGAGSAPIRDLSQQIGHFMNR